MTPQERDEILSKDYLVAEDLMQLLGVDLSKAYTIIRDIRRQTDRLGIQGKVHIQDYIDYFKLDITRYRR